LARTVASTAGAKCVLGGENGRAKTFQKEQTAKGFLSTNHFDSTVALIFKMF
jgi:hypothetical protein